MNIKFFLKKKFYTFFDFNKKNQIGSNNIIIKGENKNWVLNQIASEYKKMFLDLFDNVSFNENDAYLSDDTHLFIMSKYYALKNLDSFKNKIYFPYYHGLEDIQSAQESLEIIKNNLNKISKIQVSNSLIENFFLENKISKDKFMRIPITVDTNKFDHLNKLNSEEVRESFNIPKSSFVIGSFQKDGDGWGKGNVPKLIKGPDIFVNTIKILKNKIPELFVLLSGPSRGFVKNELDKLNVKYKHVNFYNYDDLIKLYKCINVYLISSREEGGPRAIMESFASKTPLVSTNVGQAVDMIKDNFNAFKADKIDQEILADLIFSKVYIKDNKLEEIINNAYITAKNNSYENQAILWRNFFGFKE